MASPCPHTCLSIAFLNEFHSNLNAPVVLNGAELSIPKLHAISQKSVSSVAVDSKNLKEAETNAQYLDTIVRSGKVIYGVSTGFGGSADVRSSEVQEVQKSLVRHLNAGFSTKISPDVTRGVMAVRANSLSRAMSGVRPDVIKLLTSMLNHDIIPEVPMRGSVSASGDLMPTSYVAAAMSGRPDCKVRKNGKPMLAPVALAEAGLEPVIFGPKEALGVVNSSSFAASLGASVLYETNKAVLLTQVAVALSIEALLGRRESFHPTISSVCLPHPGHIEVAGNVWGLLDGSKFAITQVEVNREDKATALKQDRYALRTSAQWLAAVPETLMESVRRVEIELNSTGDNPIIDHHRNEILHCGNFQGTSVTVAMDQTRQAIQLCGKLLFAQMSEILNVKMSNGLPPNLNGSDTSLDFGYKGTDTAMASYMSELDWLTPPLTNHVLSAEMHNQSVNSLALISARRTKESLDLLYMMLVNIMNAQVQAIDLRFLQRKVQHKLKHLFHKFNIKAHLVHSTVWPWYEFAFNPERTTRNLLDALDCSTNRSELIIEMTKEMNNFHKEMVNGAHKDEIASSLGRGSSKMYTFLRKEVGVKFYHAERTLDNDLEKIHSALTSTSIDKLLIDIFDKDAQACQKIPTSHKIGVYSRL